ncbi:hypothetical protein PR202_gb13587 [Eleusine coracana subsp. coracana]|uniref:NB-ARC domain-containing protein n=1 Tax=Eleusine coracana subsp. coracana TaxID=191504 RepID=A0AAV5ET87_ELECO|nr:hypothetical protein PR202_gb13587 [Eleusine coracana subsp. coracana]
MTWRRERRGVRMLLSMYSEKRMPPAAADSDMVVNCFFFFCPQRRKIGGKKMLWGDSAGETGDMTRGQDNHMVSCTRSANRHDVGAGGAERAAEDGDDEGRRRRLAGSLGVQLEFQELYAVLEKVQRKVTHAEPLVDSRSSAAYSLFLTELRHVALAVDEALDGYSASTSRSPYRHKARGLFAKAHKMATELLLLPRPSSSGRQAVQQQPLLLSNIQEVLLLRPKIAGQFKEAGKDLRILLRLFTTYVADLLPLPHGQQNPHESNSNKRAFFSQSLSQGRHGLIGRSQDQANVSRLLQLQQGGARVIAIVGMAGVGKTALARAVSMAAENDGFHHTLWVDVSQDFNPEGIFRLVMSQLQQHDQDSESYWWSLNEGLINKKYLLVLDDVWNEDPGKWNQLMHLLYGDVMNRGKIIVTTRILAAAKAIRAAETYHLRPLSVEDTLKLLAKNNKKQLKQLLKRNKKLCRGHQRNNAMSAAAAERSNERQVAERCSGLPCIINFMSRSLAAICENEVDDPLNQFDSLCANNKELQSIAEASYNYLPPDLQRFHQAERQAKKAAVLPGSWLNASTPSRNLGPKARLDIRCIVYCTFLHATKKKGFTKLLQEITSKGLREHTPVSGTCRSWLMAQLKNSPTSLSEQKDLRTLILLREQQIVSSCLKSQITEIPYDYCRYLTSLRILDMQAAMINKLPREIDMLSNLRYLNLAQTEIAELPHSFSRLQSLIYLNISQTRITAVDESITRIHSLRYLNISRTVIRKLPDSMGTLRLLQTLQLSHCERLLKLPRSIASLTSLQELHLQGCQYLSEMPQDIRSMKSLKELNILDCYSLDKMPSGLSALTKVEALPRYITTNASDNPVLELQGLRNLKRLGLESIEEMSVRDAAEIQLQDKYKLEHLTLHCNKDAESSNPIVAKELLDNLKPNQGLKTLEIICYAGERFPCWMPNKDPHLKKLTHIRLINVKCKSLPALGQLPHLMTLEISGMNAIKHVGKELNGEPTDSSTTTFRSLKSIIFSQMVNLESWPKEEGATCPYLEELSVIQCPKFRELSMELPIKNLTVSLIPHDLLRKEGIAGVASSLRSLSISLCEELSASSSKGLTALSSLEKIVISGCDQLESLPPCAENLASLKSVTIIGCSRGKVLLLRNACASKTGRVARSWPWLAIFGGEVGCTWDWEVRSAALKKAARFAGAKNWTVAEDLRNAEAPGPRKPRLRIAPHTAAGARSETATEVRTPARRKMTKWPKQQRFGARTG